MRIISGILTMKKKNYSNIKNLANKYNIDMLSFYEFSNIKILFNIHTNDILLYRLVLIIYIYKMCVHCIHP